MMHLFIFIDGKSCFSVKNMILTSERRAEHPFAGSNTQQIMPREDFQMISFFL